MIKEIKYLFNHYMPGSLKENNLTSVHEIVLWMPSGRAGKLASGTGFARTQASFARPRTRQTMIAARFLQGCAAFLPVCCYDPGNDAFPYIFSSTNTTTHGMTAAKIPSVWFDSPNRTAGTRLLNA